MHVNNIMNKHYAHIKYVFILNFVKIGLDNAYNIHESRLQTTKDQTCP